jgi:hypothetical protein
VRLARVLFIAYLAVIAMVLTATFVIGALGR